MIDNQCYMWPQAGNETPRLGRKVHSSWHGEREEVVEQDCVLMMPLYGTLSEWVVRDNLKPYPSEPIPEPGLPSLNMGAQVVGNEHCR